MMVLKENRPKGIGGSTLIKRSELIDGATHILELGVDKVTKGGEGELTCEAVARRANKATERRVKAPLYLSRGWAMWGGDGFTHVYTDGSYREEACWGEMLLGNVKGQAGGAVILSDGLSWFHKIYVKMDIEIKDAGQVELICLLITNEMARAQGKEVVIGSD